MRFARITSPSYVDGPGRRAVLYVQGCSIHCPGCQNQHLWAKGGHEASAEGLAKTLVETGLPLTISGGEPFDQPLELAHLLVEIRRRDPARHIIVYTGRTFEELVNRPGKTDQLAVWSALVNADILVDGPYVRELDAPDMQYRGSTNQRVIDIEATFHQRTAREILTLGPVDISDEWDTPELILTEEGDLLAASPIAGEFSPIGEIAPTRRCGEA